MANVLLQTAAVIAGLVFFATNVLLDKSRLTRTRRVIVDQSPRLSSETLELSDRLPRRAKLQSRCGEDQVVDSVTEEVIERGLRMREQRPVVVGVHLQGDQVHLLGARRGQVLDLDGGVHQAWGGVIAVVLVVQVLVLGVRVLDDG